MAKVYQEGFELNTVTDKLPKLKGKGLKHEKWCDKKGVSQSTKHFTFIGCKCWLEKIKIDDEPENRN